MLYAESHQFSATTPAFNLSHLYFAPLSGWCLSFAEIFSTRKLECLGYRVALFVWPYFQPFQ